MWPRLIHHLVWILLCPREKQKLIWYGYRHAMQEIYMILMMLASVSNSQIHLNQHSHYRLWWENPKCHPLIIPTEYISSEEDLQNCKDIMDHLEMPVLVVTWNWRQWWVILWLYMYSSSSSIYQQKWYKTATCTNDSKVLRMLSLTHEIRQSMKNASTLVSYSAALTTDCFPVVWHVAKLEYILILGCIIISNA